VWILPFGQGSINLVATGPHDPPQKRATTTHDGAYGLGVSARWKERHLSADRCPMHGEK
jgi:hypothetical protein